jgi:hypothetical protein
MGFIRQYVGSDSSVNIDLAHFLDSISALMTSPQPVTGFDQTITTVYGTGNRQVTSFLGLDPINVPAGTQTDTTISLSGFTVYAKLVGCLVRLSVTTGSTTGDFPLGYFIGFRPHSINGANLENAFSDSNMITITLPAALSDPGAPRLLTGAGFRVAPQPLTPGSPLSCYVPGNQLAGQGTISLFDTRGTCQASSPVTVKDGWNQLNLRQLNSGMYTIRFKAGNQEITRHIIIAR